MIYIFYYILYWLLFTISIFITQILFVYILAEQQQQNKNTTQSSVTLLDQKEALITLFKVTYGYQTWKNKKYWLDPEVSYCSWYGVTCDKQLNIIELHLRQNYLMNYIPEIFNELPYLKILDLGYNTFESYIPQSICNLPNIQQIILDGSNIKGEIPTCLCNKNLTVLDLSQNTLSGYNQGCNDIKILIYNCNNIHGTMNYQLSNVSVLNTECNMNLNGCEQRIPEQKGVILCGNDYQCSYCQRDMQDMCPYVLEGSDCGDYVQDEYLATYYYLQQNH